MFFVSQDFFEKHKHPILVFDPDNMRILKANPATAEYFGKHPEDVLALGVDVLMQQHFEGFEWSDPESHQSADFQISDVSIEQQSAKALSIFHEAPTGRPNGTSDPEDESGAAKELQVLQSEVEIQSVRLRQMENLATIGYWEINCETLAVRWSEGNFEIYGLSAEAAERAHPTSASFVHPNDNQLFEENLNRAIHNGSKFESVHRIIRADGQVRYVREVGETLDQAVGGTFYGITQDITDLYLAQVSAEHLDELMIDAGVIARVGGWNYDSVAGTVTRSPVVAEIAGNADRLSVAVDEVRSLYADEYTERHKEVWEACLNLGQNFDEVMEFELAQGSRIWVRITGRPVWDESRNAVVGIRGALQDISEIVKTRQRSDEMSLRLKETLEGIPDSFMIISSDWEVVFANRAASEMMGVSRSKMIGNHLWKLFPEAEGSEFHTRYKVLLETGLTQRFVARSPRSDRWLSISAYATSQGMVISARDVSDEHARNEELKLLQTVVARTSDVIIVTKANHIDDPTGPEIIFVNDAFEQSTGFTSREVLGKTPRILQGPETQRSELDRIRSAIENWEPVRSELINYTKSGELIWLDLSIVPIKDESGQVTHWVAIERDATERKQAEHRVRLSEERFRLVAAATDDVVWDCDLQSDQMWWNERLLHVFGHDAAMSGDKLNWWDANLHPDEAADALQQMQDIIDGKETFWELRYRFRRADGTYAHVRDKGSVLRDETGKATRILGAMTDISRQIETDEQLWQAQKMEAIGKLTGGVAHDFNNLLAIIMGNLELLKEEALTADKLPHDAHELIDAGIAAVHRGADLTDRMLAYARKARLKPVETDVNEVVEQTLSWMKRTINANIAIETDLCAVPLSIHIDPNSLQNAVINLVLNARDAIANGGTIRTETRNVAHDDPRIYENRLPPSPNGYVLFSLTDDGPGISPSDLKQVFDPFFTTKPIGSGSGLGLSMVQGFMSQSEGEIRIHSQLGKGTRIELYFKVSIPLRYLSGQERLRGTESKGRAKSSFVRRRVLLVEDETEVRRMLERMLTANGFDVVAIETGDTAFDLFQSDSNFDLMITDITMPGSLQGGDLAVACRRVRADIPIVFLSGHALRNETGKSAHLEQSKRLMKPLSQHDLLDAVEQLIEESV